ncbi:septation protein A [Sphingomonas carotinifaciens]|uniref:Inner membrane-spanning protein YciB n=1 Tax=Sphingomonas carotinifaciens TaxID=1166323 RepID=A0A1G7ILH8_9SPHN|nr:septation protein A [Sphingomonas carotinifaciens]MBB4084827.1 intracellular septation protein [Sphingomonas carotinifaciens]SDF13386.1 intracellular septation protein [Sphingomonas carotinifaciens]
MTAARDGAPDRAGLKLGLEYGPLLLFFAVNFLAPAGPLTRVLIATGVFMAATVVAMIVSRIKLGRVSTMLWLSGALVLLFGALTLYFRDERFIKMKPTIVYTAFSAILTYGLITGRPLLEALLGSVYAGLTQTGWRKVTRNWAIFFAFMAVLNEVVWRSSTWDFWVGFKLWGAIPLTLGFALANIPMLMRNGLSAGEKPVGDIPPE